MSSTCIKIRTQLYKCTFVHVLMHKYEPLYKRQVMNQTTYLVFFLHLKKVLKRKRMPSCSAVTDICWKSLWLSLLCTKQIDTI